MKCVTWWVVWKQDKRLTREQKLHISAKGCVNVQISRVPSWVSAWSSKGIDPDSNISTVKISQTNLRNKWCKFTECMYHTLDIDVHIDNDWSCANIPSSDGMVPVIGFWSIPYTRHCFGNSTRIQVESPSNIWFGTRRSNLHSIWTKKQTYRPIISLARKGSQAR